MRGKLGEISIVGLIKIFHDSGQSGRLSLVGTDGRANLFFAEGELVQLEIDGPMSADGPYDIFRWREGEFELAVGELARRHNVSIPITTFLARAEEFEKRWAALTRTPLGAYTLIVPREVEPEALTPTERKLWAALGEGCLLIHLAQKLEWGLTAAAECVSKLWAAGAVTLENAPAAGFRDAVAALLANTFRNYEIFAGTVLAGRLVRKLREYAARLGLRIEFAGAEVRVPDEVSSDVAVGLWRAMFGFMLSEMAGPVGKDAATSIWRRALEMAGPVHGEVINRYRLDVTRWPEEEPGER